MKQKILSIINSLKGKEKEQNSKKKAPKINKENISRNKFGFPMINESDERRNN
jgi:hypothetical protein